jgi:hypothetical protein
LLKITIIGDGSEIFDYNLPVPNRYYRNSKEVYTIEYKIKGVFWTKKSVEYFNDILLRFNISMKIKTIETTTINNSNDKLFELKSFKGLESIRKKIFIPNHNKFEDSVFWGLKLFTEHYIRHNNSFLPYQTLQDYAFTHYVDLAKDKSTLKAKCRSIWNYYNERDWKPQTTYIKKPKEETMATRLEHVKNLAKKKKQLNEQKIKNAIEHLQKENKKITAVAIAKLTKLHKNTTRKYNYLWKKK